LIEIKKDKIRINLNKNFYSLIAVEESLKDFDKVCYSKIRNKNQIEVILEPKDKKLIKILGYEFCNYVLGLMKNKTLV